MDKREKRKKIRMLLGKWGNTLTHCARLEKELTQLLEHTDSALDIKSRTLDGMPRSADPSDATAKAAQIHMDRMERHHARIHALREEIETARRFESCINEAMTVLSDKERAIIELRYKRGLKYERIAEETCYSPAAVYAIEASGVDQLIVFIKFQEKTENL
jgi:RNA polymerase sigma factor (sigma-70 family)